MSRRSATAFPAPPGRLHTQRSSASTMADRKAGEVKVTRYIPARQLFGEPRVFRREQLQSRSVGLQGRWSTEDNNRSWTLGFGFAGDRIDGTNSGAPAVVDQHRRTRIPGRCHPGVHPQRHRAAHHHAQPGAGVLRQLPRTSFVEPAPRYTRDAWIALLRWTVRVEPIDASLRASWRFHDDVLACAATPWAWTGCSPGALDAHARPALLHPKRGALPRRAGAHPAGRLRRHRDAAQGAGFARRDFGRPAPRRLGRHSAVAPGRLRLHARDSADVKVEQYRQSAALRPGRGAPGLDRLLGAMGAARRHAQVLSPPWPPGSPAVETSRRWPALAPC